ncbi:reverse transcriptase domain-containing protein [Tanacetum coccineum]
MLVSGAEGTSSPVCQKKRILAKDRNEAITAEVTKLVEALILKEVYFPRWVANPVMVRKSDGTWRMCIDFTNMNKACPKDSYPLPEIDKKIESLDGFKYKYFLDTYKGYHQIRMAEEDEEKTAFYTEHGTFCYEKMPFGLKNAEETYQWLVDKAFSSQIGQNIEIYVDNMVIKRKIEGEPQGKTICFGPIPNKVNRESASIFQNSKGVHRKKKFLVEPGSRGSIPEVSHETVSFVLMAERGNIQRPIYFVNKALQGPEMNYPVLKKLALAPVHTTRHLRRYFQAHKIYVLTHQSIRQIFLRQKNSGRIAKWAIELGEHDISYKPRSAIKG